MPETWVSVNGVKVKVVDPQVGVNGLPVPVQKIWVGVNGSPQLVFQRFTEIVVTVAKTNDNRWDRLVVSWPSMGQGVKYVVKELITDRTVDQGTLNTTVIDYNLLPNTTYKYKVTAFSSTNFPNGASSGEGEGSNSTPALNLNFSVAQKTWSSLDLKWGAVVGVTGFEIWRGTSSGTGNHTRIKTLTDGTVTSYVDENLASNTRYYYTLKALRNGTSVVSTNGTDNAVTKIRQTLPGDTGAIYASSCGSYRGKTSSPSWGVREYNRRMWIGYAPDVYKDQHSGAFFPIPKEVRNCAEITKVEVSFRVQYVGSNGKQWPLVVMVNPSNGEWPAIWPSSTLRFLYPIAYKVDTWLGCTGTAEWLDITECDVPTNHGKIKQMVLDGRLQGIGFAPDQNSGYGYANFEHVANMRPRLRIQYKVWEP